MRKTCTYIAELVVVYNCYYIRWSHHLVFVPPLYIGTHSRSSLIYYRQQASNPMPRACMICPNIHNTVDPRFSELRLSESSIIRTEFCAKKLYSLLINTTNNSAHVTQTLDIHSASCSSRQWRRNQRELRVVSQWEEGQQGESDHKPGP